MARRHETLVSLFNDIADAIRAKTGDSTDIVADNFDEAIEAIPSGGGGSDDYFWIENKGSVSQTISSQITGNIDVSLQISIDKTTWNSYTPGNDITIGSNTKIYFKNNKNYLSIDSNNFFKFIINSSTPYIYIGGRINSLINNIDGKGCYLYSYINLFHSCKAIIDASQLIIPTYISSYSCQGMFTNCTSLTSAPQLPAVRLSDNCYSYMFSYCTSLTTAPELPATTLASSCYNYMFQGCSSLKVYSTSGEGHDKAWNIPSTGPITEITRSMTGMFARVETDNVPSNWPGTTGQQFTYYTQNTPV